MRVYEIGKREFEAKAPSPPVRNRRVRVEPWVAVLLNVLLPGLGHGYCRMWLRGLTFFMLATGFTVLGMISTWANFAGMTFLSPVGAIFYVVSILDVYRCSMKSRLGVVSWLSGPRVVTLFAVALVLFTTAFFVVVTGTMAVHFVGQAVTITSDAMLPLFVPGDKVLVNKQVRSVSDLHGGDVVALEPGPGQPSPIIRRVIAVSGQRIRMEEGQVWVNGKALEESYATYRSDIPFYPSNSRAIYLSEFMVPPGSLFLLADVRDFGEDSREWGPVEEGRILGRVDFRFYPTIRHHQFADSYLSKLTHRLMVLLGR